MSSVLPEHEIKRDPQGSRVWCLFDGKGLKIAAWSDFTAMKPGVFVRRTDTDTEWTGEAVELAFARYFEEAGK